MTRVTNGAELLCATLEALGVEHAFGVPGSQNVLLYDALRRSNIRSVLTTHELGAGFMANGYYRASGKVAALVTIPGPGFAYAVPALAEAHHDSVPLLHIVAQPATTPGKRFQFQALNQRGVANPITKLVQDLDSVEEIERKVTEAYGAAVSGEPGPVLLHWSPAALGGHVAESIGSPAQPAYPSPTDPPSVTLVGQALRDASRPVLFVGQGAVRAAHHVVDLAELLGAPVFTTTSGRGIVPEDHPLALPLDFAHGNVGVVNEFLQKSDCVLALGTKLSHSGTGGFQLKMSPEQLIHVDASEQVLGANYEARLLIRERAESFVQRLLSELDTRAGAPSNDWNPAEIESWRSRLRTAPSNTASEEPVLQGVTPPTAARFFSLLRRVLPRNAIVVTDSGLHQGLVRRHFDVLAPRGLILPSDFQSMGFGLPAAIGAGLAAPERPVVAIIGDGAFAMSGLELLTAVREEVPLTVVLFNDGRLNQIRLQQQGEFGHSESVDLVNPDFEAFALSVGAKYVRLAPDAETTLQAAVSADAVTLVEVLVGDSMRMQLSRVRGYVRETARRALGPRLIRWLKGKLRRRQTPGTERPA